MKNLLLAVLFCATLPIFAKGKAKSQPQELFPDGTPIPEWFYQYDAVDTSMLGKQYKLTDYGVTANDTTLVQTAAIQALIDLASAEGGGVIVVPQGTFLSGSLFFKPGTHLFLEEGSMLKGSDNIADFDIVETRVEGQTLSYFAALVNADGVDGFTISGKGTINGNGLRFWTSFWLRRKVIPKCTNMDELRPRLVYISRCKDVQLEGVRLINSPFWTTHFYKCENVKLLNLYIYAPTSGVKAPSSDAIDVDACTNMLVKNCFLSVNDDAIALKGGKGPWADEDENNGGNYNILIEDCEYGVCHSAITCGSESIFDHNIVLRRVKLDNASNILWLKMRPDTPQRYEYITVDEVEGTVNRFLYVYPWKQFFDLKGREDIPFSTSAHVVMKNIRVTCNSFFAVAASDDYALSDFTFENLEVTALKDSTLKPELIDGFTVKNVTVNGVRLPDKER